MTFDCLKNRAATDSLKIVVEAREKVANVPADYRFITLENSPVKTEQSDIYQMLAKYVATFAIEDHAIKSLYLYSSAPGTGKTTTAAALLNEYILTHVKAAFQIESRPDLTPALFVDVNELQTLYNKFNRPRVPEFEAEKAAGKYYKILRQAERSAFVVLDDIGVRSTTDGFRGDLHTLINERVTAKSPTVYTSNIAPEALHTVFDNRLSDRVMDQCLPLHFGGESKRGMRK